MAQRFPVPNTGSNGPPPQRYPPSSVPPNLRQYSGPNFPMQQRSGFTPPPQMSNAAPGPGGIMRPNQAYTNMRQGPMPTPPVGKRSADQRIPLSQQKPDFSHSTSKKKKKLADKILPQKVRDLVPESQAYMDLLAFERKLDATIMRKRLDIQEALLYYILNKVHRVASSSLNLIRLPILL